MRETPRHESVGQISSAAAGGEWTIAAVIPQNNRDEATGSALALADRTRGRLILLDVVDPHAYLERTDASESNAAVSKRNSGNVDSVVLPGPPELSVARYADFMEADAIVLFRRPAGRWRPQWKSSVPDSLLRTAQRPVWLVNSEGAEGRSSFQYGRVVCFVALDASDEPAIRHATSLAARTGAELVLIHVLPPAGDGLLWWRMSLDQPVHTTVANVRMGELARRLSASMSLTVRAGAVQSSVASGASSIPADVVVVPYAAGFERQVRRPNPATVLRNYSCPVAFVPAGHTQYSGSAQCAAH